MQSGLAYLIRLSHLAVRKMPGSGSGQELMAWAGIDAEHIAEAARRLTADARF
jgi:transketolase